jgi:hypothetical protein
LHGLGYTVFIEDFDYEVKLHVAALTALLRVMMVRSSPLPELVEKLTLEFSQLAEEGARLRARLPAYLARRRPFLDMRTPLLPPLLDMVHGYLEPFTTEELWATGLGADPLSAYIAQRRALLDKHCPLPPRLWTLVHCYVGPPETEMLWASEVIADPLPGYLARRRALLDSHCLLPAPLRDLVHYYMEPPTAEELWALDGVADS